MCLSARFMEMDPIMNLQGAAGEATKNDVGRDAAEALNERAVVVMDRMTDKLTGRDFHVEGLVSDPSKSTDPVPTQVSKLIGQATNNENLCQAYIGWCPFW